MVRTISLALAAIACALPGLASGQQSGEPGPLTIDDLLALRSVSSPAISPDGEWIAYAVETIDVEADESSTQLYMVSRSGADLIQLTSDEYAASSPQWSPDGRYLGFLAAKGGDDAKPQVWTLDRRGGESQQYTNVDQGVSGFLWSPDGSRMLLSIRDKTASDLAADAAAEAGEEPKPLPYVIDRLQFKRDGVPYLDRSRVHLYIVDERDAEPFQLTFGDYDDGQPAWHPDGSRLRRDVYIAV